MIILFDATILENEQVIKSVQNYTGFLYSLRGCLSAESGCTGKLYPYFNNMSKLIANHSIIMCTFS